MRTPATLVPATLAHLAPLAPLVWLLSLAWATPAAAGEPPAPATSRPEPAPPEWEFFPRRTLYPRSLADPRQPRMGLRLIGSPTGHRIRLETALGAQWSLVRWNFAGTRDPAAEIEIEAANFQRFDIEHDFDSVADDNRWGFPLVLRSGGLAVKLHFIHVSSHLADEWIQRTGKERVNYRKEEIVAGLSWEPWAWLRAYAEAGYGFSLGREEDPPRMRPGRVQGGLEFRPFDAWPGAWPFYVAGDFLSKQEVGWNISTSLEAGVVAWTDRVDRTFRVGIAYFYGREPLNEYFFERTHFWAIVLSTDF